MLSLPLISLTSRALRDFRRTLPSLDVDTALELLLPPLQAFAGDQDEDQIQDIAEMVWQLLESPEVQQAIAEGKGLPWRAIPWTQVTELMEALAEQGVSEDEIVPAVVAVLDAALPLQILVPGPVGAVLERFDGPALRVAVRFAWSLARGGASAEERQSRRQNRRARRQARRQDRREARQQRQGEGSEAASLGG